MASTFNGLVLNDLVRLWTLPGVEFSFGVTSVGGGAIEVRLNLKENHSKGIVLREHSVKRSKISL